MKNLKQERYDYLRTINDPDDAPYNDKLYTEQCQLSYELNPDRQYWRDRSPNLTPQDIWGVDTSVYDK